MKPVLVLVGPPGAGKSTVGRLLAHRLGVRFRDTDADIVQRVGKPIAEVFIDDGEEHFRALERAAVETALQEHDGVELTEKDHRFSRSQVTKVRMHKGDAGGQRKGG